MSTSVTNNMIAFDGGSFSLRNKIINGEMLISQRGTTFPSASSYTLDRWAINTDYGFGGRAGVTISTEIPHVEFQSSLRVQTSNQWNANTQPLSLYQIIEGYNVRDLINQPFTLSFWVRSFKTGTYTVCLNNNGDGTTSDRSYVVNYNINAQNTWEKKTIIFPGLITTGTWNWTNGKGLIVRWTLAGQHLGPSFTLNSWSTGNIISSVDQTNFLDSTNNYFEITGVQLERGVTATPFEHRPFSTELSMCQRYYQLFDAYASGAYYVAGTVSSGAIATTSVSLRPTMRIVPQIIQGAVTFISNNAVNPVISWIPTASTVTLYIRQGNGQSLGNYGVFSVNNFASAEL